MVGGDFNQWKVEEVMANFIDMEEADVGPTRNDSIDITFTNFSDCVTESGTVPPLETDDSDRHSDHRIANIKAGLPRNATFEWETYSYRYYSKEGAEEFGRWVVLHDWECVLRSLSSNDKAKAYQGEVDDAMERIAAPTSRG